MVSLACRTIWVMAMDAGRKIESSVATLSLCEKRSGHIRHQSTVPKCRRFSKGSLRIRFSSRLSDGVNWINEERRNQNGTV